MTTFVDDPSAPTGGPETIVPAPEAGAPTGGAPEGTETPPQGLPVVQPDGVMTSGRGSHQDTPPSPSAPATAPPSEPTPAASEPQEVTDLPEWAQKIIKDARDDAAKARTNAKASAAEEARNQLAQDIGRALGLVTDDTPPEEQLKPDQLRDLLQGERASTKMARTELAVYKAAQGGGGFNASALLDSRAFLDSIKDVDPTDGEALAAKIAEAVQANPWLAAPTQQAVAETPAPQPVAPVAAPVLPPPSGGSFAGGPGGDPQDLSTMSIDDFRRLRRNAPRP